MMGTWIVLGVLVIGVVMALLTVRKNVKGGGCPGGCSGCSGSCQCHRMVASPLHGKYLPSDIFLPPIAIFALGKKRRS